MLIDYNLEKFLKNLLKEYFNPHKRKALSLRYPFLKPLILRVRYILRFIENFFDIDILVKKSKNYFPYIVARHQSVLRRKLGDSDPRLQERKIQNLKQAIKSLDGIIIESGKIFSFWTVLGKPSYKKGYVDGMLLSNGKVIEGLGGGLCQLSNFLHWIFLHAPVEIVERYHHSMDVFPDSGRVLSFGSGATVLYNFVDLKVKNISNTPLQIKLWLTDTHLKGQILSLEKIREKYHVYEKNHFFIKANNQYFRSNELYKETKIEGKIINSEKLFFNFAPILYKVDEEYLKKHNYTLLDFTGHI